ncbi:MAG: M20/M25/M40 family metallo-hydrolase [Dactylosporangium sp.]|nr:M20/M25/M40 family metallo-hydrolase [Dactylosporangium sp.]NNJ60472.1 M20/M25/M40 family metallo-hydrolase [Dactylosporangium sp.]
MTQRSDGSTRPTQATEDVIRICRDLLRIDTTNTGQTATSAGERVAAEYVAEVLSDIGLTPMVFESEPGRISVVTRVAGVDRSRPALLLHGHLDVVPAEPDGWRFDPFGGEIADGYLWGRGAVDMKHFDAMMLALLRQWHAEGWSPPRDLIFAFLADEESGGRLGAHFLVDEHPDVFADCTEAVGEVGGFSCTVAPGRRLYLIETAQKGIAWLRLHATGRPGHGSMVHPDNAVTALAEAVARLGRQEFPVVLTPTVRTFLSHAATALGLDAPGGPSAADGPTPDAIVAALGPIASMVGATLRNTANPTRLEAGYKDNVIPARASATIDCRTLPGQAEAFVEQVRAVVGPDIAVEFIERQPALETSFDGPLVAAMRAALLAEDPGAVPVPYMLSAGTDAKAFSRLGLRCFGFTPLRLAADLNFGALFHGVDERVPLDGLQFGVRVLDRFLRDC